MRRRRLRLQRQWQWCCCCWCFYLAVGYIVQSAYYCLQCQWWELNTQFNATQCCAKHTQRWMMKRIEMSVAVRQNMDSRRGDGIGIGYHIAIYSSCSLSRSHFEIIFVWMFSHVIAAALAVFWCTDISTIYPFIHSSIHPSIRLIRSAFSLQSFKYTFCYFVPVSMDLDFHSFAPFAMFSLYLSLSLLFIRVVASLLNSYY